MTTYIIDGYNLLHRYRPELLEPAEIQRGGLETARQELEARLREFVLRRAGSSRVILVYDGSADVPTARSRKRNLEILFSRPPQKADDVILECCRELGTTGDVRVVTSDFKDIGGPSRALGVRAISSEEFARTLDAPAKKQSPGGSSAGSAEKPGSSSAQEVEDWLVEFDFLPKKPPDAE